MTDTQNRKTRRALAAEQAKLPIKLWIVSAICVIPNGPQIMKHGLRYGRSDKEVRDGFAGEMLEGGTPSMAIIVDEQIGLQRIPGWKPPSQPPAEPANPDAPPPAGQKPVATPLVPPPHPDDLVDDDGEPEVEA